MIAVNLQTWLATLRTRGNLTNTVSYFAQAVGEMTQAQIVGVFLLDYLGQNFLLFSSWSKGGGPLVAKHQAVPMDRFQDPLCFSLNEGKPYHTQVHTGLPNFTSLGLLPNRSGVQNLLATPLLTRKNQEIGGILVGYGKNIIPWAKETAALVDFGAMLPDRIIRIQKDYNLLNSLYEDIHRLDGKIRNCENTADLILIGCSNVTGQVRDQIIKVKEGKTDVPILITGETETGKELVASAIHGSSPRCNGPFIKISCGVLPESLLESELFGHKKDAFSGAASDHIGLLRSVAGGHGAPGRNWRMAYFCSSQITPGFSRLSSACCWSRSIFPIGYPYISATNANMEEAIANGRFRPDLYHRLHGFRTHMPSLSQRKEDIPLLILYFLRRMTAKYGCPTMTCHPDTMQLILSKPFPGNLRELFAELEQAILIAGESAEIQTEHFLSKAQTVNGQKSLSLHENLAVYETMLIESVISSFSGNITKTAQALGIPRTTLSSKLRKKIYPTDYLSDSVGLKRNRIVSALEPQWTSF